MRIIISGGAAIDPDILTFFNDLGFIAIQGYGLTECAPLAIINHDRLHLAESVGEPIPGSEAKILDPDENGVGEICVKGDTVMLGYYKNEEATKEVLDDDGWYHTGDLGYIDEDGYAHITGRKKNVIITKNGKNVFPEELEYYLSTIPFVQESFVFGQEILGALDHAHTCGVFIHKAEGHDCAAQITVNDLHADLQLLFLHQ